MNILHYYLKDCVRMTFISIALKGFKSFTLMRLLDTKDRFVAVAAARELLFRLVKHFTTELNYLDDFFFHLSLFDDRERAKLFAVVASHVGNLSTDSLVQTITMLP